MLSRKLCEQLDDAGFEKRSGAPIFVGDDYFPPTLTDLIYGCGDSFEDLHRENFGEIYTNPVQWVCSGKDKFRIHILGKSSNTPEEAVANLWLALNTKELEHE